MEEFNWTSYIPYNNRDELTCWLYNNDFSFFEEWYKDNSEKCSESLKTVMIFKTNYLKRLYDKI